MDPDPLDQREVMPESLKHDINAFLWQRLPPQTTLREAEAIAVRFYETIANLWRAAA